MGAWVLQFGKCISGIMRTSFKMVQVSRLVIWQTCDGIKCTSFTRRRCLSPLSVSPSGSCPRLMRKPTRPSGTETGWTLSWTGWPACCRSPRMSSPSWTSCPCCASQSPTSASRVSSKVKEVEVSRGSGGWRGPGCFALCVPVSEFRGSCELMCVVTNVICAAVNGHIGQLI